MSRLRSGQSTRDAWARPFRRTTLQLRLRTQESAAALSPGTVPSTIRTSKDWKQLASPMRQPPAFGTMKPMLITSTNAMILIILFLEAALIATWVCCKSIFSKSAKRT